MDDGAWLGSVVRAACAEALALVLPVACAGCDEPDVALCEACRAELRPGVTRSGQRVGVWSGLAFAGVPARVVRALKEEGRTGLARELAPALRAAVEAALRAASEGVGGAGGAASARSGVVLVPIPTSRAAFRRRGYRVVELVAHRAGLRTARLLHASRATADQRGLGRRGASRQRGALAAAPGVRRGFGSC